MGYEDIDYCHLAVDRTQFLSFLSMKDTWSSIKCEDILDQLGEYYLFEDMRTYIHAYIYVM
jgi:hypothetical protein